MNGKYSCGLVYTVVVKLTEPTDYMGDSQIRVLSDSYSDHCEALSAGMRENNDAVYGTEEALEQKPYITAYPCYVSFRSVGCTDSSDTNKNMI